MSSDSDTTRALGREKEKAFTALIVVYFSYFNVPHASENNVKIRWNTATHES